VVTSLKGGKGPPRYYGVEKWKTWEEESKIESHSIINNPFYIHPISHTFLHLNFFTRDNPTIRTNNSASRMPDPYSTYIKSTDKAYLTANPKTAIHYSNLEVGIYKLGRSILIYER